MSKVMNVDLNMDVVILHIINQSCSIHNNLSDESGSRSLNS